MNKDIQICISVANRIINRTNAQNMWRAQLGKPKVKLTGRRLQEILYLCQLFWYIDHEDMIPKDFYAWPNGPTIPEIYNYWLVCQEGDMHPVPNTDYTLSEEEAHIINAVVDNTVDLSTYEIIDFTQLPNGPWEQVYKGYQGDFNVITKDSIKEYIRRQESQEDLIHFIKSPVSNNPMRMYKKL